MASTWYIDPVNGLDANSGVDWAHAWQTINFGATTARIAAGDTIRIAKTPNPVDVGQTATWTSGAYASHLWKSNSTLAVTSSTNANPIVITTAAHTLVTGDYIGISGHTTNTNANGVWQITVLSSTTFSIPVAGNGVGGASGLIYKLSNQIVTLSSPVTAVITNCDVNWTAGTSCTSALSPALATKEGIYSVRLTTTTPSTSVKLAYFPISTTSFAAYNQISFWMSNTVAITANQYSLCLCSDNAGATPVNTIAIPAIPSISQWVAFTVDTGGALGSSIQSVALYTGSSAPPSNVISLDHIIACGPSGTASSLSLTSLIGVNDGVQGWFNIRSINGTVINLDNGVNSPWSLSRGYYGATTTAELWRRETYKQPMMATASPAVATMNTYMTKSGSSGSPITYSGGWNTATNLLDGDTYWDGQNGFGSGLCSFNNVNYLNITGMNFSRFSNALSPSAGSITYNNSNFTVFNVTNCGSVMQAGGGTNVGSTSNWTVSNISFMSADVCNMNAWVIVNFAATTMFAGLGAGMTNTNSFSPATNVITIGTIASFTNSAVVLTAASKLTVSLIVGAGSPAISVPYGSIFQSSTISVASLLLASTNTGVSLAVPNTTLSNTAISGGATGIALTSTTGNLMRNVTLSSNTNDIAITSVGGVNYLVDSTFATYSITGSADERFFVRNPNSTVSARCYSDNMVCLTDTTTVHTAGTRSWSIATSRTLSSYPATLNLGYVVLNGPSVTNTIQLWVYSTSAAMVIGAQIAANQIEGMTSPLLVTTTGTANTWIQITLTISANTQPGPVMLQAYALSSSGTQTAWFADVSVS